ncbi:MAG: EAL domain-containing protein [Pseudomonadota bacterium]
MIALTVLVVALARLLLNLRRASRTFEIVAQHSSDGIVLGKLDGTIIWCNDAYCRMMQRPRAFWIGKKPQKWVFPPDERPSDAEIEAFRFDIHAPDFGVSPEVRRNIRADGSLFWNQFSLAAVNDGRREPLIVLTCRDVTKQVEREDALERAKKELEHAVNFDALTGLANRRKLTDKLQQALSLAAERGTRAAVLHIDLDKFKEINDTHGHAAGDAVLTAMADLLDRCVRDTDLAARVGGDEFILVITEDTTLDALEGLAQRIVSKASKPLTWEGLRIGYGASIGIAVSSPGMLDGEELIQQADFALYEAKANGRGTFRVYDTRLRRRHVTQKGMAVDLVRTIREAAMDFHFQPIMNLKERRVAGVETLARWHHPQRGMIQPVEFLAMANDTGILEELDQAATQAAINALRTFDERGHDDLYVTVNTSFQTLSNQSLPTELQWTMDAAGFEPHRLVVEVLESVMLKSDPQESDIIDSITNLSRAGFTTLLDDFGIGYAGLSHLAQIPVSGIKIDRSLVRTMLSDRTSDAIIRAIVGLAEELDLKVVAEGVESGDLARRLPKHSSMNIQGYGLARPMPLATLMDWLDTFDPEHLLQAAPALDKAHRA